MLGVARTRPFNAVFYDCDSEVCAYRAYGFVVNCSYIPWAVCITDGSKCKILRIELC